MEISVGALKYFRPVQWNLSQVTLPLGPVTKNFRHITQLVAIASPSLEETLKKIAILQRQMTIGFSKPGIDGCLWSGLSVQQNFFY